MNSSQSPRSRPLKRSPAFGNTKPHSRFAISTPASFPQSCSMPLGLHTPLAATELPGLSGDRVISKSRNEFACNDDTSKPFEKMMKRSKLNERTSSRRFSTATGFTPIEFVQALRIEEGKQMLETDKMSNDDAGSKIGYEDPAPLKRMFNRSTGLSPAARIVPRSLNSLGPRLC